MRKFRRHRAERLEGRLLLAGITPAAVPQLEVPAAISLPTTFDSIDVRLRATDADAGDTLTFSAIARSSEYYLDQVFELGFSGDLFQDFGGLDEKWVLGGDATWYYVTPDGGFFEWHGGGVLNRTQLAQLATASYDDPSLIYDASADVVPPASVTVTGEILTVNPDEGFVGSFSVEVSVSDGTTIVSELVPVEVLPNTAPGLEALGSLSFSSSQDTIDVPLSASDPEGDDLTFSAEVMSAELHLDQSIGFQRGSSLFENWSGSENERWVLGDDGNSWYFITPDGQLWRWLGGNRDIRANAVQIASLSVETYDDPALLYDAAGSVVPATVSVDGSTLTIDPEADFVGSFAVEVTASDASGLSDSETLLVTVRPFNLLTVDQTVNGKSYQDLSALTFQFLAGDTVDPNLFPLDFPGTDPDGRDANDNQFDPDVFFVAPVFGPSAVRSFDVPADKHLLFMIGGSFWLQPIDGPEDGPDIGVINTRQALDATQKLYLEIDGFAATEEELHSLRSRAERIELTLPENNWFDLADGGIHPAGTRGGHTIDSHIAVIDPLPPGQHTIRFGNFVSGTLVDEGGFTAEELADGGPTDFAFGQDVLVTINVLPAAAERPAVAKLANRVDDEGGLQGVVAGALSEPDRGANVDLRYGPLEVRSDDAPWHGFSPSLIAWGRIANPSVHDARSGDDPFADEDFVREMLPLESVLAELE